MARSLTDRQKKHLDNLFHNKGVNYIDEATKVDQNTLQQLNDYETVWQDANRYLTDLYFERQRAKDPWQ